MTSFNKLFRPLDSLFESDLLLSEHGLFNMCQQDKLQEHTQAYKMINKKNLNNLNQLSFRFVRQDAIDFVVKYNK